MNKKGFTLIELLAVLVVLAILALISVPITIRIINNARENSYKRSIANYGNVFRKVIAMDNMESASNDYKPLSSYVSKVEEMYTGNRVQCNLAKSKLENGKLQLVGCIIVKEVQENYDKSKNIAQYEYAYNNGLVSKIEYDYYIGDTFTLNGDSYHIIANSLIADDYVVALKDTPLTVNEVNTYGAGHVNQYTYINPGTAYDIRDDGSIGGVQYYSSETCGYANNSWISLGCKSSYNSSEIKYIVDGWAQAKFTNSELKTVDGYSARLITFDEVFDNFDYELDSGGTGYQVKTGSTIPRWVYNSNCWYYTMTPHDDSLYNVWRVYSNGNLYDSNVDGTSGDGAVRPVINVYKSKLPS